MGKSLEMVLGEGVRVGSLLVSRVAGWLPRYQDIYSEVGYCHRDIDFGRPDVLYHDLEALLVSPFVYFYGAGNVHRALIL